MPSHLLSPISNVESRNQAYYREINTNHNVNTKPYETSKSNGMEPPSMYSPLVLFSQKRFFVNINRNMMPFAAV